MSGVKVILSAKQDVTDPEVLLTPFIFFMPPTEDLSIDYSHSWTEYDTLREGQRSRPGGPQLPVFSFSTLFLDYSVPWGNVTAAPGYQGDEFDALARTDELVEIMETGTPFTLLIGNEELRGKWDYEGLATLRSMRRIERAGEPDARYVDLSFVGYERLLIKVNRRSEKLTKKRVHRLSSGDTLTKLSTFYYGEQTYWYKIQTDNGIKGVTGNSASGLAAWAKKHDRKTLNINPRKL